jgi:hypothetical protein
VPLKDPYSKGLLTSHWCYWKMVDILGGKAYW